MLAALAFCVAPASVFMSAAYTERHVGRAADAARSDMAHAHSLFAALVFAGLLDLARSQEPDGPSSMRMLRGALWLASAAAARSNGNTFARA